MKDCSYYQVVKYILYILLTCFCLIQNQLSTPPLLTPMCPLNHHPWNLSAKCVFPWDSLEILRTATWFWVENRQKCIFRYNLSFWFSGTGLIQKTFKIWSHVDAVYLASLWNSKAWHSQVPGYVSRGFHKCKMECMTFHVCLPRSLVTQEFKLECERWGWKNPPSLPLR